MFPKGVGSNHPPLLNTRLKIFSSKGLYQNTRLDQHLKVSKNDEVQGYSIDSLIIR